METKTIKYRDKIIEEIKSSISESESFFITSFTTLPVLEVEGLRRELKKNNVKHLVTKKTLGGIALKDFGYESLKEKMEQGTCAMTFTQETPVTCSKILMDFQKKHENFNIIGGVFGGEVIGFDKIKELADLPSREVLLANVLRSMMAPLSNFVGVSKQIVSQFVRVVDAYAKKKNDE